MFVRRPGLAAERVMEIATLMYNSDCQKLPKMNYADFQSSNGSSNCDTAKINTDSQNANKASKRREINVMVKS